MSSRTTARVLAAALAGVLAVGAALVPGAAAVAVEPPPPAYGSGTWGSTQLTPTLAPGESVTPTSLGLGKPVTVHEGDPAANDRHSATTEDGQNLLVQAQVETAGDTALRLFVQAGDPSVQLRTEVTWIEPRDLDPTHWATIEGPAEYDRFDLARPFDGLWLIDVHQVSGPAGVWVDLFTTTAKPVAPLTLSPATVTAANPTVTARWSGLERSSTYIAGVLWAGATSSTILQVTTETEEPVATTTTARLSSPLQFPGRSPTLDTRATVSNGALERGELRLVVDGVVRSTRIVTTGPTVHRLPIPRLPAGLHYVKAEFRSFVSDLGWSESPARRLVSLQR